MRGGMLACQCPQVLGRTPTHATSTAQYRGTWLLLIAHATWAQLRTSWKKRTCCIEVDQCVGADSYIVRLLAAAQSGAQRHLLAAVLRRS